jgi:hypothetical protein
VIPLQIRFLSTTNESYETTIDTKTQQQVLQKAAAKLNIKQASDWYKVNSKVIQICFQILISYQDLIKLGGQNQIATIDSLSQLLSTTYPDQDYQPWKFNDCPPNFWNDLKNQRKFMDWAGKQLQVSDWYKISIKVTGNVFPP